MGRPRDHELYDIRRIMAILQAMPLPQRRRVLVYINERIDLMPEFLPPKTERLEEDLPLETT